MMVPATLGYRTAEDDMLEMIGRFGQDAEDDDRADDAMRAAQDNFLAFLCRMVPGYIDGEHLRELRDALVDVERGKITRLIVTMPPRHSKSIHVSENFPAWFMGRSPHKRVIAASHTARLAHKFSRRVREKVEHHLWPFPDVALSQTSAGVQSWELEGYGSDGYSAVGVGGSPTGIGADLIVIDDAIRSQADADSPVIREALWEWYTGTMYTRRQPGCAIIVTGTRWHDDDLTGKLLEQQRNGGEDQWVHIHMKARDDDGRVLWPEFWSEREYTLAERNDPVVWRAQYQGDPTPREGNLLERHWFQYAPYGERYVAIVQSWDTASKPGISNDWSACVTIGVSPTSFDVLDVWRHRVKFPDLLQAAKDQALWAKTVWPGIPYQMLVEDANSGSALIQTLGTETTLPVQAVKPIGKDPKMARVRSTIPLASSHRIRLLADQPWINQFLSEVAGFPTAQYDDVVDAFTIGVLYASGTGSVPGVTVVRYANGYESDDEGAFISRKRTPPPPRGRVTR
jgi:predicted phage terminase large subunit-like protein